MTTQRAIDAARFSELQEAAGAEFVVELIETFLEDAPRMLDDLRHARTGADGESFRRAAHTLKSNANTFGAVVLGVLARDLELTGLHVDAAHDERQIDALAVEYERAAAELRKLARG